MKPVPVGLIDQYEYEVRATLSQLQGEVSVTFLKDIYTEEILKTYNLEPQHIKALLFMKENGRINNKEYQELFGISKRLVSYDLQLLVDRNFITKIGSTAKGTYYILQRGNKDATTPKYPV